MKKSAKRIIMVEVRIDIFLCNKFFTLITLSGCVHCASVHTCVCVMHINVCEVCMHQSSLTFAFLPETEFLTILKPKVLASHKI